MTNIFERTGTDVNAFFGALDREYYKIHPEQWEEGEFFICHPEYEEIIAGRRESRKRERRRGEYVTAQAIWRDGYQLWSVRRVYVVKEYNADSPLRTVQLQEQKRTGSLHSESYNVGISLSGIIGKLRLVKITPGKRGWLRRRIYDELHFEVVSGA